MSFSNSKQDNDKKSYRAVTDSGIEEAARRVIDMGKLVPEQFDYVSLTYTGDNITSIAYLMGGSGGTLVATLTLTYDGSDKLTSIAKS